ncbi:pyridoxal phosphate phosphatase PHOSPHO2 [Drosophila montana]|uniref:pyridoxal phosphate phosphatase PHOSPHO2 n=1 Tax=Drosophila montana TaxID=40370 RepID=UPI00313B9CB8
MATLTLIKLLSKLPKAKHEIHTYESQIRAGAAAAAHYNQWAIKNPLAFGHCQVQVKVQQLAATMSTPSTSAAAQTTNSGGLGKQQLRRLAAFDFDHTIVSQNTDTVVRDMLPNELISSCALTELMENECWTEYMAEIFRLLYAQQVPESRIRDTIRCIPEVPGFVRLIKHLQKKMKFDLIIISDSNSIFIDEWLRAHNLSDCFNAIFTNPAEFNEHGQLLVRAYHQQTDCKLSASNLCKGRVLEHFVIEQDLRYNIRYDHVFYVGDGNNDICPVLRQRACDFACARQGFAMEKHLIKNRNKLKLRAHLLIWRNGFDLLEQIRVLPQLQGPPSTESQAHNLDATRLAEIGRRASAVATAAAPAAAE